MSNLEMKIGQAIRRIGTRRVADLLGISREGALSLAAGVATRGTEALAAPNLSRLDRALEAA